MGKIGDLWIKLGIKKQEFDKGMDNAEKKTESFGEKMGKLKGIGLAVWGAIGGAILKIGKDMVNATNEMEDKWAQFMAKSKAAWLTFIRTLISGDWKNFVSNFKKELDVASYLQEIKDADTEIMNSILIQKAQMTDKLAELEIEMRNQTKSYKERAAAAREYLRLVEPIYQQEIKRAEELKKAHYEAFLGTKWGKEAYSNAKNLEVWDEMIKEYGNLNPVVNGKTMAEILFPEKTTLSNAPQQVADLMALGEWALKRFDFESHYTPEMAINFLTTFFKQYETNRNGEEVQALVEAIIGLENAKSAYNRETKKVQSVLNASIKGAAGDIEERIDITGLEKLEGITSEAFQLNVPDIIPDDWLERNREKIDAALAEVERLQAITDEINRQFEDAVVMSLSNATQALTDTIAGIEGMDAKQVLAALLQPFGDTMISLGEMLLAEGLGIEAFKESLKSLNGVVAIAAGAGLIALGSALSSGIRALADGGGSTSTGSYTGGSSTADVQNYTSELTIYVEGRISGSDIVLAGNKTINKWRR